MFKKIFVAALVSLFSVSAVHAGKNVMEAASPVVPVTVPFYIGVGGVMGMVSTDCACGGAAGVRKYDTTNFGGLLRVGYDFNPYFGIEARALRSQLSRNFATTTHVGLYAKPQLHISDAINVYALAGYGYTRIDCDYKTTPIYKGRGWSFGGGIEYDFASHDGQGDTETGWGAFVDYQNLMWNRGVNKVRSNVVSAGITYDF